MDWKDGLTAAAIVGVGLFGVKTIRDTQYRNYLVNKFGDRNAESFSAENKTWEYREEIEELDGREHYYTFLKMARQAYTGMYIAAREAGATPNQAAAFCSSKWLRYMDDGDLIGNDMVKMWGKWFGLNDITDMVGEGYEISEIPRTELYENMEQIAKSGKEFNEKFYDAESFSADSISICGVCSVAGHRHCGQTTGCPCCEIRVKKESQRPTCGDCGKLKSSSPQEYSQWTCWPCVESAGGGSHGTECYCSQCMSYENYAESFSADCGTGYVDDGTRWGFLFKGCGEPNADNERKVDGNKIIYCQGCIDGQDSIDYTSLEGDRNAESFSAENKTCKLCGNKGHTARTCKYNKIDFSQGGFWKTREPDANFMPRWGEKLTKAERKKRETKAMKNATELDFPYVDNSYAVMITKIVDGFPMKGNRGVNLPRLELPDTMKMTWGEIKTLGGKGKDSLTTLGDSTYSSALLAKAFQKLPTDTVIKIQNGRDLPARMTFEYGGDEWMVFFAPRVDYMGAESFSAETSRFNEKLWRKEYTTEGDFVDLMEIKKGTGRGLVLLRNRNGIVDGPSYWDSSPPAIEWIEDIIANSSWNYITADQLGALSEAPVLAKGYYDDGGNFVLNSNVAYYFGNYQIEDWGEVLDREGEVFFHRASFSKAAESHAYSYAYNEGHSDSRKREEYRPNLTSARQEGDFKKILKQKGD